MNNRSKWKRINFFLVFLILILLGCQNKSELTITKHKLNLKAIVEDQTTLIVQLKNNNTKGFYIPENINYSYSGDTLYMEAIFKRRRKSDPTIYYNEFMPPKFKLLAPGSLNIRRVKLQSLLMEDRPAYLSMRIYLKTYQDNQVKVDKKKYSEQIFLDFEKENSFLQSAKITYKKGEN